MVQQLDRKNAYPKRFWLNFILLIAFGLLFVINFISLKQINDFITANNRVVNSYKVIRASTDLFLNHAIIISNARGYVITHNENFLKNHNEQMANIYNDLATIKKKTSDNPTQQLRIAALMPLIIRRANTIKNLIELKRNNKLTQQASIELVNKGQIITDNIKSLINNINQDEITLLRFRYITLENKLHNAMMTVLAINFLSIGLLLTIIFLFNRRLTEHILLEKTSRKSAMLLKGIINGTNDYISAIDLNYKYIAFNKTFVEEFKRIFRKMPVIGMSVEESLAASPSDIESVLALWSRALKGEEFTIIQRFGNQDKFGIYEVTFNGIYDHNNILIGASHIARNIHNRIEQEKALQKAKDNLEVSFEDLKKHDIEISSINEMNRALLSASCLQETLEMTERYCKRLLGFTAGVLYIMNSSRNYLEPMISWNMAKTSNEVIIPEMCWALRLGKIYKHINQDNLPCKHVLLTGDNNPYFCVPLSAQNNIIGLLYLKFIESDNFSTEQFTQLAQSHEFLIENLAGHISLAIANMKLQDALKIKSIRDSLTGLYNRSYLDESLNREIERARRNKISLAIVMIDLDHFKYINDSFGHEAGDLALIEIGKLFIKHTRKSDLACRYGGEEFLIMFYDITLKNALERCEIIRKEISELQVFLGKRQIEPISASFGIAMFPADSADYNQLKTAADKALFKSKKLGRNRISVFAEVKE